MKYYYLIGGREINKIVFKVCVNKVDCIRTERILKIKQLNLMGLQIYLLIQ